MRLSTAYQTFYERWNPELSEASRQRHSWDVRRWSALMPDKPIALITTMDLQQFRMLSTKANHSPSTTETTIRTVKQILNAAASFGEIDKVPYSGRGRKIRRKAPQPATAEELRRLWMIGTAAARWPRHSSFRNPRAFWKGWIMFAYWTGLRLSDLTWGLTRDHFEPGLIRYTASKTQVQHVFPMRPELWQIINARKAEPGPIFNCYRKPSRLRMHLARMCEAAEIRRLTSRHFRQASVTAWTMADSTAGGLIHGSNVPNIMKCYLDPAMILKAAMDKVIWPFET